MSKFSFCFPIGTLLWDGMPHSLMITTQSEDSKCLKKTFLGGVKQTRGVIQSGKDLSVILKNRKEYVVRNILK